MLNLNFRKEVIESKGSKDGTESSTGKTVINKSIVVEEKKDGSSFMSIIKQSSSAQGANSSLARGPKDELLL